MKLILVRHGETEANVARIMQGCSPGVLSKLGKEQAKKLADRLKNEKIDCDNSCFIVHCRGHSLLFPF